MGTSFWGDAATQFFYQLTPDRILDAVEEATGFRCTGQLSALNSMENRVYEIYLEPEFLPPPSPSVGSSPLSHSPQLSKARRSPKPSLIAKFYRPGRWTKVQIEDEHRFLGELHDHEIPVVAPRILRNGTTLYQLPDSELFLTLFPRIYGRSPDEFTDSQLAQVGRLLARIHQVGATHPSKTRVTLSPASMGLSSLTYLKSYNALPIEFEAQYADLVQQIIHHISPWFESLQPIRIHGDCHLGNLIFGQWGEGMTSHTQTRSLFFVDFDDMMMGPPIQDLWLLAPGRDSYSRCQQDMILDAYQTMAPFDKSTLRLIEPLRTLRMIHFSGWIARRWEDPSFKKAFDFYGTQSYWADQVATLKEQWDLISKI
jgi:Ser/Thr protein kinase RdoA (MazF antagonist)